MTEAMPAYPRGKTAEGTDSFDTLRIALGVREIDPNDRIS
jgi:hypothetical protein